MLTGEIYCVESDWVGIFKQHSVNKIAVMLQTGGKLCNLQNFSIAEQYRLILEKM